MLHSVTHQPIDLIIRVSLIVPEPPIARASQMSPEPQNVPQFPWEIFLNAAT